MIFLGLTPVWEKKKKEKEPKEAGTVETMVQVWQGMKERKGEAD